MKVDLLKLEFVVCGREGDGISIVPSVVKFGGLAESLDLILPAPIPEPPCVTCTHLNYGDKNLMSKGSAFALDGMKFILCKACVIEGQCHPERPRLDLTINRSVKIGRVVMEMIQQLKKANGKPGDCWRAEQDSLDEEFDVAIQVTLLKKKSQEQIGKEIFCERGDDDLPKGKPK